MWWSECVQVCWRWRQEKKHLQIRAVFRAFIFPKNITSHTWHPKITEDYQVIKKNTVSPADSWMFSLVVEVFLSGPMEYSLKLVARFGVQSNFNLLALLAFLLTAKQTFCQRRYAEVDLYLERLLLEHTLITSGRQQVFTLHFNLLPSCLNRCSQFGWKVTDYKERVTRGEGRGVRTTGCTSVGAAAERGSCLWSNGLSYCSWQKKQGTVSLIAAWRWTELLHIKHSLSTCTGREKCAKTKWRETKNQTKKTTFCSSVYFRFLSLTLTVSE